MATSEESHSKTEEERNDGSTKGSSTDEKKKKKKKKMNIIPNFKIGTNKETNAEIESKKKKDKATNKGGSNGGKGELRIILVGSAGAGKSATGNSILRNTVFESRASAVPVTTQCQKEKGEWEKRPLLVMDTPGILPSSAPAEELVAEKERCAQLSSFRAHALLLVLQAGRFTAEEREAVQSIQRLFGKEALKFTMIVFTRKEDLEGKKLKSFVRESEKKLKEVIKSCGRRVCAFNNRATGPEREQQVGVLIQKIDKMVKKNGKKYDSLEQENISAGNCAPPSMTSDTQL